MSRYTTHAITAGLIGSGALAWALAARPLVTNPDLKAPLNPFGINTSPYGEVFAIAMQGPIDTYFHGAWTGGVGHTHKPGESCEICEKAKVEKVPAKTDKTLEGRFRNLVAKMESATDERTNPKPASQALRFFLRREAEDKLRFAYNLDPAHYGNYNSLHFFLTEPQMGTRKIMTPAVAKLADDTIQYCLKEQNDPRPMLTAAGACTNILLLMFEDQQNPKPLFNTTQMRSYLNLLDHCISNYMMLAKRWDETKSWDLLSAQKITECEERFRFIGKIREATAQGIIRFEARSSPQAAN